MSIQNFDDKKLKEFLDQHDVTIRAPVYEWNRIQNRIRSESQFSKTRIWKIVLPTAVAAAMLFLVIMRKEERAMDSTELVQFMINTYDDYYVNSIDIDDEYI